MKTDNVILVKSRSMPFFYYNIHTTKPKNEVHYKQESNLLFIIHNSSFIIHN